MGSLGSYKYPEHTIDKVVEIVEVIHNKGISKQKLLAEELGHDSSDSGAFRNKITSLRRYGMIQGRGDIQLSDLAKQIVSPRPNSSERELAIGEAVENIELLTLLYKKLDYQRPDDDFWYQLVEITDAERSEARKKSGEIKSLYSAGLNYAKLDSKKKESKSRGNNSQKATSEESLTETAENDSTIPEGAEAILVTADARIAITNKATYAAAKALFDDIEGKFE